MHREARGLSASGGGLRACVYRVRSAATRGGHRTRRARGGRRGVVRAMRGTATQVCGLRASAPPNVRRLRRATGRRERQSGSRGCPVRAGAQTEEVGHLGAIKKSGQQRDAPPGTRRPLAGPLKPGDRLAAGTRSGSRTAFSFIFSNATAPAAMPPISTVCATISTPTRPNSFLAMAPAMTKAAVILPENLPPPRQSLKPPYFIQAV